MNPSMMHRSRFTPSSSSSSSSNPTANGMPPHPNVRTPSPIGNPSSDPQRPSLSSQTTTTTTTNPYHRPPVDTPFRNTEGGGAEPPSHATLLESKLHATAASFRQSRDTAHRAQQLAAQRLRLVQEEVAAAQRSVQAMQQHWQSLQETYAADQKQQGALQQEVQRLSNEVRFQHAEWIGKRNQLQEWSTRTAPTDRAHALEALRRRRRPLRHGRGSQGHWQPAWEDLVRWTRPEDLARRWSAPLASPPLHNKDSASFRDLRKWQRLAHGYRSFLAPYAAAPSALEEEKASSLED